MTVSRNYYHILSVPQNANVEAIKRAYRKLALQYHPDRNHGQEEKVKKKNEEAMKELVAAYQVLSDPRKRRDYDLGLKNGFNDNLHSNFSHAANDSSFGPFSFFDASFQLIQEKITKSALSDTLKKELLEFYKLSRQFKRRYKINAKANDIDSLLQRLNETLSVTEKCYIDAVINAYQEDPLQEPLLVKGVRLLGEVLLNPSEENVVKCKEHIDTCSSWPDITATLKKVAAVALGLLSCSLIGLGMACITMCIPVNLAVGSVPIGLVMLGIGAGLSALGMLGIYASIGLNLLANEELYGENISLKRALNNVVEEVECRLPIPGVAAR